MHMIILIGDKIITLFRILIEYIKLDKIKRSQSSIVN